MDPTCIFTRELVALAFVLTVANLNAQNFLPRPRHLPVIYPNLLYSKVHLHFPSSFCHLPTLPHHLPRPHGMPRLNLSGTWPVERNQRSCIVTVVYDHHRMHSVNMSKKYKLIQKGPMYPKQACKTASTGCIHLDIALWSLFFLLSLSLCPSPLELWKWNGPTC